MKVTLGRLQHCTFEQMTQLWNKGFEGYYSDMSKTTPQLLAKLAAQSIRPDLSVVAFDGDRPIGFVFLAFKTIDGKKLAWNGGSGLDMSYRGKGIGKQMMIEAERIIEDEQVDAAYLEVVTKNKSAIGSYRAGGFKIADTLVGMRCEGRARLEELSDAAAQQLGLNIRTARLEEVARLPFYKEDTAWLCQWHNIKEGNALIAYEADGSPVGYVLFKSRIDLNDVCHSVQLLQCEAAPGHSDPSSINLAFMRRIFATGTYSEDAKLNVSDLSVGNSNKKELLQQAGFTEVYEQYLMVRKR